MEDKWGQGDTEYTREPETESDMEYEQEKTAYEGEQALTMDEINLEAEKKSHKSTRKDTTMKIITC